MSLQRAGLLYRLGRSISQFCVMILVLFSITCGQLTTEAQAQDTAEMSAVYGRGVHAYFANRMARSEQLFSQVVQAGSTDPRVYYFRAMTRLRTGRQYEAEDDMKIGAAYEARDPGSQHSIGIALQRVQGHGRRTLERFRREGRLNRVQQRRQQSRLRYEQLDQRGPQVLRSETPVQSNLLSEPSMQLIVPGNSPTPALPIPEEASKNPADPVPEPEASDSNEDLFGNAAPVEPVTPEAVEANDDPFADAAEVETEPPMAEEEVAVPAAADDLFSDPVPENESTDEESPEEVPAEEEANDESDDLFGDSDSTEPPAEDSTDSTEDDPFGEAGETEADMEEESPAEEADIFDSEEEPADSAEDDDPFSSTRPKDSSEVPSLAENHKVESSKLFGILGRVVSSTVPWKGIQLPTVGLPTNAQGVAEVDSPEGIALDPVPTAPGEVTPAAAEATVDTPAEEDVVEDDPFGDAVAEEAVSEEGFPEEAPVVSESSEELDDLFDESDSFESPADSTEDDLFGDS